MCDKKHGCLLSYRSKIALQSRASLLSSAIPWASNSCTADKNITVIGCVA